MVGIGYLRIIHQKPECYEYSTFRTSDSPGLWNRCPQGHSRTTISGEGFKTEPRSYKTFSSSLTELKEWLLSNGITHVAMESTGVYWKPVYKVLECPGMKVWIVNTRHIKYVPGHKTDKQDSAWICKLLLAGLLKPSYIPEREQRELRDLTRYRNKLIQHVASEKNCTIRILES